MLAQVARRRKIQLKPADFLTLLEEKHLGIEEFVRRRDDVVGWETITMTSGDGQNLEYGGVIVGLQPSDTIEIDCGRMWVSALLNTAGLDTFVSKSELGGIAKLLRVAGVQPAAVARAAAAAPMQ
jgi:hypothetical protein